MLYIYKYINNSKDNRLKMIDGTLREMGTGWAWLLDLVSIFIMTKVYILHFYIYFVTIFFFYLNKR